MSGAISTVPDTAAMQAARQGLANATAAVDQDHRNHSPSCAACDQKLVDKADVQMAQALAAAKGGGVNVLA